MMFGGLRWDAEGKNVFAKLINLLDNKALTGVGCPAHILNNCVRHAVENLDVYIECIIFKICQYFHIYAVQTEQLKKSTVILWKLNTRNFFPTVRQDSFHYVRVIIHMFPALKLFFLAQVKSPKMIGLFLNMK
jgi:hypothetical protein